SLVTVTVKEAVSPGWITALVPSPVTDLEIARCASSVTLAESWRWMMFGNAPRFWARVKATVAVLVNGVGSPAWTARVLVKRNDAPGARSPPPAAMASASRFPSRLSVNELFGSLVDRTRSGLPDELVLVTVYV